MGSVGSGPPASNVSISSTARIPIISYPTRTLLSGTVAWSQNSSSSSIPITATWSGTHSAQATDAWKFVSIPDLFNNDVLLNDPDWFGDNADGSNNDGTFAATPFVIDAIAAEGADFVLVSGDMVQGRWSLDAFSDAQIETQKLSNPAFSHITASGVEARKQHIRYMADIVYTDWNQMWSDAGQTVYTVPGDHEYGDNDWNRSYDDQLTPVYREKYAQYRAVPGNTGPVGDQQSTAFSITHKNLTLIGVDQFETDSNGDIDVNVSGDQLAWFQQELADASTTHTVVAYHAPVLAHTHARSSSELTHPGGANSALWQAMANSGKVDLAIAGEVHDISAQERDDILQTVLGSQPSNVPEFNYMVTTVYDDRLVIELKALATTLLGPRDKDLDPYKVDPYLEREVVLSQSQKDAGFQTVGTITIDKSIGDVRYVDATGLMSSRLTSLDGLNPPPAYTFFGFENDTTATGGIHGAGDPVASDGSSRTRGSAGPVAFSSDVPGTIAHRSSVSLDLTANTADGENGQFVTVDSGPYKGVLGDNARTVAGWIKNSHQDDQNIIAWGQDGTDGGKWTIRLDETAEGSWALRVEVQGDSIVGSFDLADGQWHHIAVVLEDAEGQTQSLRNTILYVDGVAETLTQTSNGLAINTVSDSNVLIGARLTGGLSERFFEGYMDEVAIWNSALSREQIESLAVGGVIPEPASIVLMGLGGLLLLGRSRESA